MSTSSVYVSRYITISLNFQPLRKGSNMTKKGRIVLLKCTAVSIRIFSACILLSLFSYWSISAFQKYLDEPIATRTEFRFGDDNLGNLSMPVISFCRSPFHRYSYDKCKKAKKGPIKWSDTIKCIQELGTISKFFESLAYSRPYEGKIKVNRMT